MQVKVTGRHVEVSPALRTYAEEKIGRLERYVDKIVDAHVILSIEKYRHIAEITLHANSITIRGEEESGDMYSSLDLVIDKIERQVRRYKERISKKPQRQERVDIKGKGPVIPAEEEAAEPRLIKTKRFAVKPMTPEEAIMHMDLVGHDFFVYRNSQTEEINVLYRRKDGNYGLIEPTT